MPRLWREVATAEEKAPFEKLAQEDKARYHAEKSGEEKKAVKTKKPKSSFMFFSMEMRPKLSQELSFSETGRVSVSV